MLLSIDRLGARVRVVRILAPRWWNYCLIGWGWLVIARIVLEYDVVRGREDVKPRRSPELVELY